MRVPLLLLLGCADPGPPVPEPPVHLADPPPGAPDPAPAAPSPPAAPGAGDDDVDAATRVIRAHRDQVQACYEASLASQPELRGRLGLVLEVRAGAVAEVRLDPALGEAAVDACVQQSARAWGFPESVSGEVHVAFVLVPEE